MTPSSSTPAVTVVPVDSLWSLHRFIKVPWRIYTGDPCWVPPLLVERHQHLSRFNPLFEHLRWKAWIACQNGRPVGRISAQIDQLYLDHYQEQTGFFGMLEAVDDAAVFRALLTTAEAWLREQGMQEVRGPFNLSINEECGLLVDGFDTPPSIMMGHSLPYYDARVTAQGYQPAQDLLAYQGRADFDAPDVMQRLTGRVAAGVTIRPMRRKQLAEELETLRHIFNDAWSENWGFVPFTRAEFKEIGNNLTMLVDDDFVQIAELNGEPVAMIVALPNINEAIRDFGGRLLPFNWVKLLWRLKVRYPRSARVPLMGVVKRLQHTRLGPALAYLVIDAVRKALIRRNVMVVELSWILEGNSGMRNILESMQGEAYKRYRVYRKPLSQS